MGHYPLGVFVPDCVVTRGAATVAHFVHGLMRPFQDEFEVPPYRRYFTVSETKGIAAHYGVPRSDLQRLVRAVAASGGMVNDQLIEDNREVLAGRVISIGATKTRLFCISTENPDFRFDWYAIGGRSYGRLTGTQQEGDSAGSHRGLSDAESVADNMAPVADVLKSLKETGSPIFCSFLTPRGRWYQIPHASCWKPQKERSWNLWHLRRFRRQHHVVDVDYHA